jgi:hypothetical protein
MPRSSSALAIPFSEVMPAAWISRMMGMSRASFCKATSRGIQPRRCAALKFVRIFPPMNRLMS